MEKYHKIPNVFKRSQEGDKRLLVGEFADPTVEFLQDVEWEFSEKVDGTNCRVMWDGHRVQFGGRTEAASIPAHLMNRLNEVFSTNEAEEIFEQKFGEREVILFGEGYGPKIQNGGRYRDSVDFILFDVMISGNYQPRESVEDVAKAFGIDVVPVILNCPIADAVEYVKTEPNSFLGDTKMEGLVGRPKVELQDRVGKRVIVKIKCKDFQ